MSCDEYRGCVKGQERQENRTLIDRPRRRRVSFKSKHKSSESDSLPSQLNLSSTSHNRNDDVLITTAQLLEHPHCARLRDSSDVQAKPEPKRVLLRQSRAKGSQDRILLCRMLPLAIHFLSTRLI